jgi:hypothetical protein
VPVGDVTKGHVFNVIGECLNLKEGEISAIACVVDASLEKGVYTFHYGVTSGNLKVDPDLIARECETALALDPGNYLLRSCALAFLQLGKTARARDFIRLDAGSEWASFATAMTLEREGRITEARESARAISPNPYYHKTFVEACLQERPPSDMNRIVHETESSILAEPDPEPHYFHGAHMIYCDQKESAVRLFKSAIAKNYCAFTALQTDPLLVKLRTTPEFGSLLSAAKECQQKFLAERDRSRN